jgi:ElaB/YqjD/DUF883 family membrane-anchored ribosome-binding protein
MGDEELHDACVIREQMTETRTALTEKLETLENQVLGTVQEAKSAVTETVQEAKSVVTDTVATVKEAVEETVGTLKESVHETVHSVKETFDVERQVRRHPWSMFGGAVALGFLGGRLLAPAEPRLQSMSRSSAFIPPQRPVRLHEPRGGDPADYPRDLRAAAEPQGPSWLDKLTDQFRPELDKVKGLAIGATLALVRDLVAPSLPPAVNPKFNEIMDDFATKLGGDPIHQPMLDTRQRDRMVS